MLVMVSIVILTLWSYMFSSKIGMHLVLLVMDVLGAFSIAFIFLLTVGWSLNILLGKL